MAIIRKTFDNLSSVPHEPSLDHAVEGGLEDPEELLLGSRNLLVCSQVIGHVKDTVIGDCQTS